MPFAGRRLLLLIAALLLGSLLTNWLLLQRIEGETKEDGEVERIKRTEKRDLSLCRLPDELAKSAMSRMKSEECKDRLREVACAIEEGTLHESFPPSTCPLYDSGQKDEYIGCYADSKGKRLLDGHSFTWKEDNSREKCGLLCGRAGYVYYGVEFGVECFCGNSMEGGTRLEEERCHTHSCPEGKDKCGGFESIAVYSTGMTKPLVWSRPEYVEADPNKVYGIRILFLLQLNGRNVRQVRQMLRSVYSPNHHYYIHVDSRQKYILNEARRLSSILPNVRVASTLRSTIWGAASLLSMVTDAIESSVDLEWDYLINMSESDELVLSMKELEAQLESRRGHSFLATHGHSAVKFFKQQAIDYVFLECENRMWRVARRPSFPSNVGLNGGSDWVVLHRSLAEYSISTEELPTKLRRLFSSVILPVESFFHSLAVNSPFCTSVVGGNLRITNWNRKQGCRSAWLRKVVDFNGCSPLAFISETATKFEVETAKKRGVYFARKFDSVVSNDAILKARLQSTRFSSPDWDLSHPRANSSFVNIFNADVDMSSSAHSSFLRSLLPPSSEGRVSDLFMYKASDISEEELVVVFGEEGTGHNERLFHFANHVDIEEEDSNIGAFFLSSLDVGTDFDHKEEILRGFSKFIPEGGMATLLLEWVEIGDDKTTNSSPLCKVEWRDGGGRMMATQTLQPYDSTRGRQFAELNLQLLNETQSGQWTATVTDSESRRLGSISFGVFSSDDSISRSTFSMDGGRLLDCLSFLSRRLMTSSSPSTVLAEISRTLQGVTARSLDVTLPPPAVLHLNGAPLVYSAIAESPSMHCSMFGFRKADDVIPMHDHPAMHGFIRVLRGSLRVTSFSLLPSASPIDLDAPAVRFNGEREVNSRDGCIYLSPEKDNIHQVRALEDGTFFFDLLIPGYKEVDCTYFEMPEPLPAVGTEMELQRCPTPASYSCIPLPYDTHYYDQ